MNYIVNATDLNDNPVTDFAESLSDLNVLLEELKSTETAYDLNPVGTPLSHVVRSGSISVTRVAELPANCTQTSFTLGVV